MIFKWIRGESRSSGDKDQLEGLKTLKIYYQNVKQIKDSRFQLYENS